MKPDRYTGLKVNDVGLDPKTNEYVLVINCRCTLRHATTADYQADHADGCLMAPSEGLVFVTAANTAGPTVLTWGPQDITARTLSAVPEEVAKTIKDQMLVMIEAERKKAKARRLRWAR